MTCFPFVGKKSECIRSWQHRARPTQSKLLSRMMRMRIAALKSLKKRAIQIRRPRAALSLSPFAFVVATKRVISSNRVLHFGLSSISMSIPQEYGDSAPILSQSVQGS
jgi:hypothetical protein